MLGVSPGCKGREAGRPICVVVLAACASRLGWLRAAVGSALGWRATVANEGRGWSLSPRAAALGDATSAAIVVRLGAVATSWRRAVEASGEAANAGASSPRGRRVADCEVPAGDAVPAAAKAGATAAGVPLAPDAGDCRSAEVATADGAGACAAAPPVAAAAASAPVAAATCGAVVCRRGVEAGAVEAAAISEPADSAGRRAIWGATAAPATTGGGLAAGSAGAAEAEPSAAAGLAAFTATALGWTADVSPLAPTGVTWLAWTPVAVVGAGRSAVWLRGVVAANAEAATGDSAVVGDLRGGSWTVAFGRGAAGSAGVASAGATGVCVALRANTPPCG
jgi:hypothetical protein